MQQIQMKGRSPHTWSPLSVGVKIMKEEGKDERGQRRRMLCTPWFGGIEGLLVKCLCSPDHLVPLPDGTTGPGRMETLQCSISAALGEWHQASQRKGSYLVLCIMDG